MYQRWWSGADLRWSSRFFQYRLDSQQTNILLNHLHLVSENILKVEKTKTSRVHFTASQVANLRIRNPKMAWLLPIREGVDYWLYHGFGVHHCFLQKWTDSWTELNAICMQIWFAVGCPYEFPYQHYVLICLLSMMYATRKPAFCCVLFTPVASRTPPKVMGRRS